MIEQLKKILERGVTDATKAQADSINKSYAMQGKGEAFREVLLVINELEKSDEGKDTTPKEENSEK
jgi:hypothetical protein